jgi:hypothetical protein
MNLVEELKLQGYLLLPEGNGNYRVKGHQGLIVKDNFWYQHSTGEGGSRFSLLKKLGNNYLDKKIIIQKKMPLDNIFSSQTSQMKEYLQNKRKIDPDLIRILIHRGFLQQDRNNNICFLGFDGNKLLKCISKRSIHDNFKSELKGSDKNYSFSIDSNYCESDLIISEGPIDLLSIACLENIKHKKGYFETHKIASCGMPSESLKSRVLQYNSKKVWLAFDNDYAGKRMTIKTQKILENIIDVRIIKYSFGKDPNEYLIYKKALT